MEILGENDENMDKEIELRYKETKIIAHMLEKSNEEFKKQMEQVDSTETLNETEIILKG